MFDVLYVILDWLFLSYVIDMINVVMVGDEGWEVFGLFLIVVVFVVGVLVLVFFILWCCMC